MIHALVLCATLVHDPGAIEPAVLARQIDSTLSETWKAQGLRPTDRADDATFLRRLSIDLLGTIPTRQEVEEFLEDRSPDKRAIKVREYLDDPAFAQNLSLLWSQELLKDADQRPENSLLRPWLEEAFAQNMPFDDVVRELVSGSGSSEDNGALGYVLSYRRTPEDLTSVTSRAFLGLQIQCAQCHDHPYEDWTQDQFNSMTAFFASIRARQNELPDQRLPEYTVRDFAADESREDGFRRLIALIRRAQGEDDGEMSDGMGMGMGDTPRERRRNMRRARQNPDMASQLFERMLAQLPPENQQRIQDARDRIEKYSTPVTLDGQAYDPDGDQSRRGMLAEWIVAPDNPYFGRAIVNRFWAHLFGKGLIEPVDDLDASDDVVLPQLLDFLALQFHRSGTDLRHLIEALVLTDAYGMQAADEKDPTKLEQLERYFAAHPVRPLNTDQVLSSLVRATSNRERMDRRSKGQNLEFVRRRIREQFEYTFGDGTGDEAARFEAGIPQALFMMNSKMTNEGLHIRKNELMQEILRETDSEKERLRQMFYATLGRAPTSRESSHLFRLMRSANGGNREGMEDLYWALLNSSEFLTNH